MRRLAGRAELVNGFGFTEDFGVILGLYEDDEEATGNYYNGLYRV